MTKNNTYAFRDHAIECEIIEPIEASGVIPDARAQFDVDAIADEVISGYYDGFACKVDEERFWEIVEAHEIADGDHRIIWGGPDDDGIQTARLMRWSDNEDGFIEIDSETIVSSEEESPYAIAETTLEARNGLHDVTSIWCR
ncbi:hypothetical protein [Cutibacterium granulosum]|uniref:hypothetical protein n=1 Tax=Cutibacterium granulosum TaxID=33011 RepID=UPI0023F71AB5|nr:hypothetical protein [Cutibacterium granulosum]